MSLAQQYATATKPRTEPMYLLPKVPFKTHPAILLKAYQRWEKAGFVGSPPDPTELMQSDEDYETEVLLFGQIVEYYRDTDKRKTQGLDG